MFKIPSSMSAAVLRPNGRVEGRIEGIVIRVTRIKGKIIIYNIF